jgi:NADPH:quinone reductase-like Zn-dependent oxidoreductase
LSSGQTVLIHGAAGGVGHVAVQIAKSRGAKVIGTASGDLDFLRELNVDQAIDYSTTHFENVVGQVDVVLDTVGGETQERSWKVLKPGGILVSTVQPPSQETATAHGVRQAMVFSSPPHRKSLDGGGHPGRCRAGQAPRLCHSVVGRSRQGPSND